MPAFPAASLFVKQHLYVAAALGDLCKTQLVRPEVCHHPQDYCCRHDALLARPRERGERPSGRIRLHTAPLLKNFGAGAVRAYNDDINMLYMLGDAKERTVEQFSDLAAQAGLAFVRAYDACSTPESTLESKLE